jgi:phosphoenolpyruvate-protein kinase (PTS system EI component)
MSLVSVANAQSGFSASDSKELASYRLTMDTTKKVFALMRAIGQEMANDPKFQALQKTKAEIAALSKKDELTDAESARLEKLEAQAEEQEEALAQANAGANMSNAKDLNQMEAAIKANPQFMAALTKVGLTAREYARWTIASLMAGMVAGFQKSGVLKELPKDLKEVNPENVKFIIEHEAELNAMRKEMEISR